jgi:hypothetical protein
MLQDPGIVELLGRFPQPPQNSQQKFQITVCPGGTNSLRTIPSVSKETDQN